MMWKQILKTTFIAGSLDIIAACAHANLASHVLPSGVLKYVASGVLGKAAFAGSYGIMFMGLLFHFCITVACTAIFFWAYPKLSFLKNSVLVNSLMIAVIAWAVTNFIIKPLSYTPKGNFNLMQACIAILILFLCIGLPISFFAKKYFNKRN
jgi:hypothetical protein